MADIDAKGAPPAGSRREDDYEICIEPNPRRMRVEFNGTWIADSTRAVIVHETRHPPMYYFPMADVQFEYLAKTAQVTHCPFKGNASYWTVKVGDSVAQNAAWSYEDPFDDGEAIKGYLSFYPDRVSAIYDGDNEIPHLARAASGVHASTLASWLIGEAWQAASPGDLMDRFCRCARVIGIPLARMTVIIPALHPQVFATVFVWRDDNGVKTIYEPHDILQQPKFKDSPFALILRGAGGVRRRIEQDDVKLDFPVVSDLKAEGATDYVAMPFHFSDGQLNVMSMSSFAAGGFSTNDLGQVHEVLPMLGCLFEVHAQRRTAVTLLQTYLGHATGRRVLAGQFRHGDGEHIHSVIWFSDLRNSTKLSESMQRDEYLSYLNRYFHCMASAVMDGGGELLSFIGDAVLAIFPIVGPSSKHWGSATDAAGACRGAIAAAMLAGDRVAVSNQSHPASPIHYGIGLHLGDVTYGNVGIPERLAFTVIGASANEAARIESMTKSLGRPVVISASFAENYAGQLLPLGKHALKDLGGERELFTLP